MEVRVRMVARVRVVVVRTRAMLYGCPRVIIAALPPSIRPLLLSLVSFCWVQDCSPSPACCWKRRTRRRPAPNLRVLCGDAVAVRSFHHSNVCVCVCVCDVVVGVEVTHYFDAQPIAEFVIFPWQGVRRRVEVSVRRDLATLKKACCSQGSNHIPSPTHSLIFQCAQSHNHTPTHSSTHLVSDSLKVRIR